MKLFFSILVGVTHFISGPCLAQDSTALFILNEDDLRSNNIQNLQEAITLLPAIYRQGLDANAKCVSGILSTSQMAIFKNDYPLSMDQNIDYNLSIIPVWDIVRIELHMGQLSTIIKNSSGYIIKLYSADFIKKPLYADGEITNSSNSDFHSHIKFGWSNLTHSIEGGINRSFYSPVYAQEGLRATSIAASERYDANFRYKYKILKSLSLQLSSDNSCVKEIKKGAILRGTTRVQDLDHNYIKHILRSSLTADLSKYHTLTINGMVHRYKHQVTYWDKDLSSGRSQQNSEVAMPYSTGYDNGRVQVVLAAQGRELNYAAGVELSNTQDNQYKNINAIATEYADYSAFGMFDYQFQNTFKLEGGLKLLTNSLTTSYLLPHARLTLAPNNVVQVSATYLKSVSYQPFKYVFYSEALNQGIHNNILLEPTLLNTFRINLKIVKGPTTITSGLLYLNSHKVARKSLNGKMENSGLETSTSTYAVLQYNTHFLQVRPAIFLHSTNQLKDTATFNFIYPEASIFMKINIPKTKISFCSVAKFIGKHPTMYLQESTILLDQLNPWNTVNLALKYKTFKDKIELSFGVTNLLDHTSAQLTSYQISELGQTQISETSIIAARQRSIYIKLRCQF